MKALILKENKKLSFSDVAKPNPEQNEVLVSIKAAALNHRELWISKGLYPGMTLPCVLGADGAGIVSEVGASVSKDWIGKEVIIYPAYDWGENEDIPLKKFRVLGMPDPGTISDFICVPVSNIVVKPKHLSWAAAAAIPVASLTAWRALVRHGKISQKKTVLITGIGGGVAQAGLSLALAFGAKVYVTSSKQEKIDFAIEKGAIGGVNYKQENWTKEIKSLSGGIDIVLDSSPTENLDRYFDFLNIGARIVSYGSTGSRKTTLNISKFFLRHLSFIGTAMGSPKEFEALISFMENHKLQPVIYKTFKFEEAISAFKYLAEGKQIGKIVLVN